MKKILLLIAAVFALGGDFEDGQAAYDRSDFVVAREKFAAACDANNGLACAKLGALYQLGKGIVPDGKKAASLATAFPVLRRDRICWRRKNLKKRMRFLKKHAR